MVIFALKLGDPRRQQGLVPEVSHHACEALGARILKLIDADHSEPYQQVLQKRGSRERRNPYMNGINRSS